MSPKSEPFARCSTTRPPGLDYRHHCVLLTCGLGPHSVAELWHATGIPVAELGPIVTQLFRECYLRLAPRERAGTTRYVRVTGKQLVTPSTATPTVETL